jgi:hypothetical protein
MRGSKLRNIELKVPPELQELELVAYIGDLRITGFAHLGFVASTRRSSDYIHAFAENRLTLARVQVYDKTNDELLDSSPFAIINLDRVDMMYAREEDTDGGTDEEPQG